MSQITPEAAEHDTSGGMPQFIFRVPPPPPAPFLNLPLLSKQNTFLCPNFHCSTSKVKYTFTVRNQKKMLVPKLCLQYNYRQGRSQGGFGGFGQTTPQEVNKKKLNFLYTCIAA